MKVLWISNVTFPEAVKLLKHSDEYKKSGGWMMAMAESIIQIPDISLSVASVSPLVKELTKLQGERITYYIIPKKKDTSNYTRFMLRVKELAAPDIIHIHGTEFSYGKAYVDACGSERVVVSIQGMISVIARYFYANLTWLDIFRNITLRDLIKGSIWRNKRDFDNRGLAEIELLKKVSHIIGRTTFDKSHTLAINPDACYYVCNESLRDDFYDGKWSYCSCSPQTIFLSQATYPLKGLHLLLKAMPIVLRRYPDAHIRIAGSDVTNMGLRHETGYGKIIRKLIYQLQLEKHVTFLGSLSVSEMKKEYLQANVFVCPSSIENSSNSLGEAQCLGVPCVASYVGGLPDMIPNSNCGYLYRFDDAEELAYHICRIFAESPSFDNSEMIEMARLRHNKNENVHTLMNTYKAILEKV